MITLLQIVEYDLKLSKTELSDTAPKNEGRIHFLIYNMKTILVAIVAFVTMNVHCKAQGKVIGENKDGQFVLTVDSDSLLLSANKILKGQGFTSKLNSVSLNEGTIENSSQKYYYIKFVNKENSIKLVQLLDFTNGRFSTIQSTLESGISVSCSGCRKGCDPKRYVDKDNQIEFYCSECTLGDTKDCKKSISQGSLDP